MIVDQVKINARSSGYTHNMSLKISVIVPIYNEEKYLPLLLDSLVNQTAKANEIIICDNNSNDNSISIVNTFKGKLPITLINQPKKGILPTVEKAWKYSTGDLIIRTDADAILPKNYIKKCINYYNTHRKTFASTGPVMSAEFHVIYSVLYIIGTCLFNYLMSIIRGYPLIIGPNTVVRRTALQEINGYQTDTHTIDDHLLTWKLHSKRHKIAFVFSQYNYHSIRRWLNNPLNIIKSILINFDTKYYVEKKN